MSMYENITREIHRKAKEALFTRNKKFTNEISSLKEDKDILLTKLSCAYVIVDGQRRYIEELESVITRLLEERK